MLFRSGQVSVLPFAKAAPLTAEAAGAAAEDTTLPVLLINDGHVMDQNLHACGRDRAWLDKELRARRLTSPRQVFLLTLDEAGTVVCVTKEGAS